MGEGLLTREGMTPQKTSLPPKPALQYQETPEELQTGAPGTTYMQFHSLHAFSAAQLLLLPL